MNMENSHPHETPPPTQHSPWHGLLHETADSPPDGPEIAPPNENRVYNDADFSRLRAAYTTPEAYSPQPGSDEIVAPYPAQETAQKIGEAATSNASGQPYTSPETRPGTAMQVSPREVGRRCLAEVNEHFKQRPPTFENDIAHPMAARASNTIIAGSERALNDFDLTRVVIEFVNGKAVEREVRQQLGAIPPDRSEDIPTILVAHLAPNTRHETHLLQAAAEGAFGIVSADIGYAQGLMHSLREKDLGATVAQAMVGDKDPRAYAAIQDLHSRIAEVSRTHLTGDARPMPTDYRTALRIITDDYDSLPPGLTATQIRNVRDAINEQMRKDHGSALDAMRTFYERVTQDTPDIPPVTIQQERPAAMVFNVGYEGSLGEGSTNLTSMLSAAVSMVRGSTPNGRPEAVVLSNLDTVPEEHVPLVRQLLIACDTQKIPVVCTSGDYLAAHHAPLLSGVKIFGSHSLGGDAGEILSKASGLNPRLTVQNESRNVGGTKGANAGGGDNKGRGQGDQYYTSDGVSSSWGLSGGISVGKSQQLQHGGPAMPAHEIAAITPDEIGVWGPHITEPTIYSINTGLPVDSFPRHTITPIEVDEDMYDIDGSQRPMVGGSYTLGTAGNRAPQEYQPSAGDPSLPAIESGASLKPRGGAQRPNSATPQITRESTTTPDRPRAKLPIPLPGSRLQGERSLRQQLNMSTFPGKVPPTGRLSHREKQLLIAFGDALYSTQSDAGQTKEEWYRWAYFNGVPGYDTHPDQL